MTNKEAIEFLKNMIAEKSASTIGRKGFFVELMYYHIESLKLAIKALENDPKQGVWLYNYRNKRYRTCSACGYILSCQKIQRNARYCQMCGARMEANNEKDNV